MCSVFNNSYFKITNACLKLSPEVIIIILELLCIIINHKMIFNAFSKCIGYNLLDVAYSFVHAKRALRPTSL